MCFPLGPFPWSLATPDGSLRKPTKLLWPRTLRRTLNCRVLSLPILPLSLTEWPSCREPSLMASNLPLTKLLTASLSMAISEASLSTRLDIVFDTYKPLSIKYNERANRATAGLQVQNIASCQKIKQWRQFMALQSNKISLIRFLVQEWRSEKYLGKLAHLHKVICHM